MATKSRIGNSAVWFHESKNLGVIFTLLFFLVILITNISLRGMASVVAILAFAFGVLLLAYFKMWEEVLNWMGMVSIYMNMGFYIFFSTLVLFRVGFLRLRLRPLELLAGDAGPTHRTTR